MKETQRTTPKDLSQIDPNLFYTIVELAVLLRVNPRTLRRYCANGYFDHATRLGGSQWRIPGRDVLTVCGIKVDDSGPF